MGLPIIVISPDMTAAHVTLASIQHWHLKKVIQSIVNTINWQKYTWKVNEMTCLVSFMSAT